jgi:hypothetical protein
MLGTKNVTTEWVKLTGNLQLRMHVSNSNDSTHLYNRVVVLDYSSRLDGGFIPARFSFEMVDLAFHTLLSRFLTHA